MSNTKEYLTRVKLIHAGIETFIDRQRNFNAAWFERHTPNWATADARLDGLRETLQIVIQLQLDLEREIANQETLERLHTDAPND